MTEVDKENELFEKMMNYNPGKDYRDELLKNIKEIYNEEVKDSALDQWVQNKADKKKEVSVDDFRWLTAKTNMQDTVNLENQQELFGGRKKRKTRRKSRRGGKRRLYRVKAVKAWLKRTKRRRKKKKTKKKKKKRRRRTRR